MLRIDWNNDERSAEAGDYLVDPSSDKESRRRAFLGGWTRFLHNGGADLDRVTWAGLGMAYASVLGEIPLDQRKAVYRLLLSQYLSGDRVGHWTDEQRQRALRLAGEAGDDSF